MNGARLSLVAILSISSGLLTAGVMSFLFGLNEDSSQHVRVFGATWNFAPAQYCFYGTLMASVGVSVGVLVVLLLNRVHHH